MPFHILTLIPETCARRIKATLPAIDRRIILRYEKRPEGGRLGASGLSGARITSRLSRQESDQQDEGPYERDVGWWAMSPRTYASSAIVLIDAMRVGRAWADGQFG